MFKFVQFWFYALQMRHSYKIAERAENEERTFQFLRKARQVGCAALQIRSPIIHERWRAAMKKNLVAVHSLYLRGLIARIPEGDLELVASVMRHMRTWADMGVMPNAHQAYTLIREFKTAKNCLRMSSGNTDVALRQIYCGRYVFPPLGSIFQSFFAGEATREQTEKRLDEYAGKLRKWLPELILFPDGFQDREI